ncbi:hypothetical protein [Leuconostoc gelidum]|uniref:hypothetical protein n=1 Tax=Leuconostoc gelidum TaxID=1244 RepID=UPI001C7D752F|nr:hypothetical protein [Leuconostoc gelidum]MBZ6010044.1 hypothetical protein [Leuconostoc gelidum subsp. aenigmaticum]
MTDFKEIIIGALIAIVVYIVDRYLPKWFGALPGIAFIIIIIFSITNGKQLSSAIVVLILGEILLNGIWLSALQDRKKKEASELEKMKDRDFKNR